MVTISAYGNGLVITSAAINPLICDISTNNIAFTLSAIYRNRLKSRFRE
mgnify:CR=1 FL=1